MKLAHVYYGWLGPVGFGFVRAPRNTSRSHCALSVRFERARNISICVGRFGVGSPCVSEFRLCQSSPRIVNRSLQCWTNVKPEGLVLPWSVANVVNLARLN